VAESTTLRLDAPASQMRRTISSRAVNPEKRLGLSVNSPHNDYQPTTHALATQHRNNARTPPLAPTARKQNRAPLLPHWHQPFPSRAFLPTHSAIQRAELSPPPSSTSKRKIPPRAPPMDRHKAHASTTLIIFHGIRAYT
jgi:hypothetical protein